VTVTRLNRQGIKPRPEVLPSPELRPENEAIVLMAVDIHRAHSALNNLRILRIEARSDGRLARATEQRITLTARRLDALCDAMRALVKREA
jgi:hypothetical protein